MSYSTIYRIFRTTATSYADFRNGWGTAPLLWDYLAKTFIGSRFTFFDYSRDNLLWDLAKDSRVARDLRLAHAWTFDRALCPLGRAIEMANACDVVAVQCAKEDHVNHWAALAVALREAKAKPRQIGWGLNGTSVSDVWQEWAGRNDRQEPWSIFDLVDAALEAPCADS